MLERMTGKVEFVEKSPYFPPRKICERIEFQPFSVGLDNGKPRPFVPVETFAAIEPSIKAAQCRRQRIDLPESAAGIRIAEP